jgi:hypothetical protein
MSQPPSWGQVWAVVQASAEHGLGRPLLRAYALLALAGLLAIGASLVAMRW